MPPPPAGGTPQQGQGGDTHNGSRRYANSFDHHSTDEPRAITVHPFSGFGVTAQFEPETGLLQAVGAATGASGGVYGEIGDQQVVFYRAENGLQLRLPERTIDLESPAVSVHWAQPEQRRTVFAVFEGDTPVCRLTYRSLPAELDLGRMIGDVCADPARRAGMFPR